MLSTIKYRFEKAVADSPENFGEFSLGKNSRNTVELEHHMYDVLFSTSIFLEEERLDANRLETLSFSREIERFSLEIMRADQALDINELPVDFSKRLLQGPFSDILTHIGQIAIIQGLNGRPIIAEDFSSAAIQTAKH